MTGNLLVENADRQEVSKLKDAFFRYMSRWPWILLCILLSLGCAYLYLLYTPKLYQVESSILIKGSEQFTDPNELLFGRQFSNRIGKINDEAIIIQSFPLMKSALLDLEFDVNYSINEGIKVKEAYGNLPFKLNFDRSLHNKKRAIPYLNNLEIRVLDQNSYSISAEKIYNGKELNGNFSFGEVIDFGGFEFKVEKTEEFPDNPAQLSTYNCLISSIDEITYAYKAKLNLEDAESLSSILTLSFKSSVPQKAIDLMNKLIDKYIEQNLEDKNKVADNTVAFIDQQLAVISDSLTSKEINLEQYKASNKIANVSFEGKLVIEKYNQIEVERAQYKVMQEYYDYLSKTLEENESKKLHNLIVPSAFGIQDEIINDLVKSLIDLDLNRQRLIADGNTKSPLLDQIDNREKEITKTLKESIQNLSNANQIILNTLDERSKELSKEAQTLPSSERQLVNLNRLLKLNENIYLFLMEKRSSAAITRSSNTADCKVIEPAMLKTMYPISPSRKMAYIIAILVGVFLPLSILIFIDFLNDTVRDKEDIERATQVPILGIVPQANDSKPKIIVTEKPKSAIAEAFRIVRTNLSFFQQKKFPFVILVTSTVAREGKTFCALNLAGVLASSGKKTIVLGFDLRKPQLHTYLNSDNTKGISDYLTGESELESLIKSTPQSDLDLLNAGTIPPNPAELLMTDKTKLLFEQLRAKYEYIIVDTPPIGLVTDALILKDEADLNLFVVRQEYSKRAYLDSLNELYQSKKITNIGLLVNDVMMGSNYGYYEDSKIGFWTRLRRNLRQNI